MNRFQYVADHRRRYGVKRLCSIPGVSRSNPFLLATDGSRPGRPADS